MLCYHLSDLFAQPDMSVIITLLLFGILVVLSFLLAAVRKKNKMSNIAPQENPVLPQTDTSECEKTVTDKSDSETVMPVADVLESEVLPEVSTAEAKSSVILPADSNPSAPNDILAVLRQLAKDFETKLKYDASKQELIDKLYKENMEFKEGLVKKFQQAMIAAVIERIDDAAKDIAIFENREFSAENYLKLLASYTDITTGFQDMLSVRFDVECYSGEPLSRFDPKAQRSLRTCPTSDPNKNKLVKQTLRPGYKTADGFVLRPELVEVYVFEKKQ